MSQRKNNPFQTARELGMPLAMIELEAAVEAHSGGRCVELEIEAEGARALLAADPELEAYDPLWDEGVLDGKRVELHASVCLRPVLAQSQAWAQEHHAQVLRELVDERGVENILRGRVAPRLVERDGEPVLELRLL